MTLLITECSTAGVVMAADSAITYVLPSGQIKTIDHKGWKKVLRAPKAKALVGYWGHIGQVHKGRFDEWLERQLANVQYHDVPTLAEALAAELNQKVGGKPLADDHGVGLHVAGIHEWSDGQRRPCFFHVHNGPGHYQVEERTRKLSNGTLVIEEVIPRWVGGPRTLFTAHPDFPSRKHSLEENIGALPRGYVTRNGHFLYHTIVWDRVRDAFDYLNLINGFSIPAARDRLGPRLGLTRAALQLAIDIFKCSNQSKIVGGKITAAAVGPGGYE